MDCICYDKDRNNQVVNGPRWQLYVDGASNNYDSGACIVLITLEGHKICYALKLDFCATNNEVEYESLIHGLKIAREIREKAIQIYSDSQFVVNQVLEEFQTKVVRLAGYLDKLMGLLDYL